MYSLRLRRPILNALFMRCNTFYGRLSNATCVGLLCIYRNNESFEGGKSTDTHTHEFSTGSIRRATHEWKVTKVRRYEIINDSCDLCRHCCTTMQWGSDRRVTRWSSLWCVRSYESRKRSRGPATLRAGRVRKVNLHFRSELLVTLRLTGSSLCWSWVRVSGQVRGRTC